MADAYLKKGDTLPTLVGVLLNPDLSPVDLTNATMAVRLVRMASRQIWVYPASVAGSDPTKGLVQHLWLEGETDLTGAYFYHWIVDWPRTQDSPPRQETFPNDSRGMVLSIQGIEVGSIAVRPAHSQLGARAESTGSALVTPITLAGDATGSVGTRADSAGVAA